MAQPVRCNVLLGGLTIPSLFFVDYVVFTGLLDTIHELVGNLQRFVDAGRNTRKHCDPDAEAYWPAAVGTFSRANS